MSSETPRIEAERRYRRINLWFFLFIALIPLGVLLPCLVSVAAYRLAGPDYSAPIALSALLWPIVGVAGALLVRGARVRARRSRDLARLAETLGLEFTRKPPLDRYAFLKSILVMENPHTQSAVNLLEGTPGQQVARVGEGEPRQASQWPMMALDYSYAYLWGSVTEYADQTLVAYPSGFANLPTFVVLPISIMGRIENFFLGKGGAIPFPHHPQFSNSFAVVGDNAPRIVGCLSQPLIELLMSDRWLSIVVQDGRLYIFRRLTIVRAEDYQAFLSQAYRVAELLAATGIERRFS